MARPTRAVAAIAALAIAGVGLSGCSLVTANAPVRTPSPVEACATDATWILDTAALNEVASAAMHSAGLAVTVTVEGSQTLEWDADDTMRLDTDLAFHGVMDANAAPGFEEVYAVKGTSGGVATFSGDTAVPRRWSEDLATSVTSTQDGSDAEPKWAWPFPLWINDTVGLEVQCSADRMTIAGRGTHLTWTFTREGATPAPTATPTAG